MGALGGTAAQNIPAGMELVGKADNPLPRITPKSELTGSGAAARPTPVIKVPPVPDKPAATIQSAAPPSPAAPPVVEAASEAADSVAVESAPPGSTEGSGDAAPELTVTDKAKKALEKARKSSAKHKKLIAEREAIAHQAQRQAETAAALAQRAHVAESHLQNLMNDPVAAMKALGYKPADLAKAAAADGTPEAQLEAIRAELRATQQQIARDQQALAADRQETQRNAIENAFKTEAGNAERYPNLAQVNPDLVLSMTRQLVVDIRRAATRRGDIPQGDEAAAARYMKQFTDTDLLSHLEKSYKRSTGPKKAPESATPDSRGKPPATITNRLASTRASLPADFAKMNDRQQKKAMAAMFEGTVVKRT